jgi:hypothetical protein
MEHKENYEDSAVERQAAVHVEATRRHDAIAAAPAPINQDPSVEIMDNILKRAAEASRRVEDSMLNWNGGPPVFTTGRGDTSRSLAEVAGVGAVAERAVSTQPRDFGHTLTSAPDGRGNACLDFESIMRHGGR